MTFHRLITRLAWYKYYYVEYGLLWKLGEWLDVLFDRTDNHGR